jgi:DNA-binding NarL/FixJ family response regulator
MTHSSSAIPRVLVADPDHYVATTLARALEAAGMEVSVACNVEDAGKHLSHSDVDVFVVDVGLPGNGELELLRHESVVASRVRVIVTTSQASVATAVAAIQLHASDYMEKPFPVERFLESVQRAAYERKEKFLLDTIREHASACFSTKQEHAIVATNDPLSTLSPSERRTLSAREREVAVLISRGMELQTIARTLFISPNTVRNHFRAIYRKLAVNSHRELVFKLLRGGNSA